MVSRSDRQDSETRHSGGEVRGKDLYLYIGYTPKRASCRYKVRYWCQPDADNAARVYNLRILFGNVGHYWCKLHRCWHIGHRDKHQSARLKLREDVMWFRIWNERN